MTLRALTNKNGMWPQYSCHPECECGWGPGINISILAKKNMVGALESIQVFLLKRMWLGPWNPSKAWVLALLSRLANNKNYIVGALAL